MISEMNNKERARVLRKRIERRKGLAGRYVFRGEGREISVQASNKADALMKAHETATERGWIHKNGGSDLTWIREYVDPTGVSKSLGDYMGVA